MVCSTSEQCLPVASQVIWDVLTQPTMRQQRLDWHISMKRLPYDPIKITHLRKVLHSTGTAT